VRASGTSLTVALGPGFRVRERVLQARILKGFRTVNHIPVIAATGQLVALQLQMTNVGRARVRVADALSAVFVRDATGRLWRLADSTCGGASGRYAAAIGAQLSSTDVMVPGESGTTAAVYSVPPASGLFWQSASGSYIPLGLK
jgi:hypothetical protein